MGPAAWPLTPPYRVSEMSTYVAQCAKDVAPTLLRCLGLRLSTLEHLDGLEHYGVGEVEVLDVLLHAEHVVDDVAVDTRPDH